jgi:hypothetical protein
VRVLKRRGPALAQPLRLVLPPVLSPTLHARAQAVRALSQAMRGMATAVGHHPVSTPL